MTGTVTVHRQPFWHWIKEKPQYVALIYGGNLLAWVAVHWSDVCIAWYSQYLFSVGRTSSFHSGPFYPEQMRLWDDVCIYGSLTAILAGIQLALGRLGWKLLRPRSKFRGSLFFRASVYAALATGPVVFVGVSGIGCLRMFVMGTGLRGDFPGTELLWGVHSLVAAAVVSAVIVRRRARRIVPRCGRCGYLLRGLASTRCPECGRAI
jgi:hypothetical protein